MTLAVHLFILIGTQKKILFELSLIPILKQQFIKHVNEGYQTTCADYFSDDMISIKSLDSNLLDIDKISSSSANNVIYIIRYITIKSINDRNLRLSASTNKNKKTLKKYTELWDEVKNQIKFKK